MLFKQEKKYPMCTEKMVLIECQCQNWFPKFLFDILYVEEAQYSRRPFKANQGKTLEFNRANHRKTICKIAER